MVECWDPRARSAVGCVKLPDNDNNESPGISKLSYLSGLQLAAGTKDGRIIIYDLRQTRPLVQKDHMYEKPINQITKNNEHNWIISTCQKSLKIWEADTGKENWFNFLGHTWGVVVRNYKKYLRAFDFFQLLNKNIFKIVFLLILLGDV